MDHGLLQGSVGINPVLSCAWDFILEFCLVEPVKVLCTCLKLLSVHMSNSSVVFGKHYFVAAIYCLWLLQSFCLVLLLPASFWRKGCHRYPIWDWTGHSLLLSALKPQVEKCSPKAPTHLFILLHWRQHLLSLNIWVFLNIVFVCGYVHINAGAGGGQQGASDTPDLELQAVVICPRPWVLEGNSGSLKSSMCS